MIPLPPRTTLFPYTTLFRSFPLRQRRGTDGEGVSNEVREQTHYILEHEDWDGGLGWEVNVYALPKIEDVMRLRSEEHTSELQSQSNLVCRLLLEKKKKINKQ